MNKLTSIQNNIYDDLNVNGFSKIKLFNNKDIADFKIQIVKILNSKEFIEEKFNINNLCKYHKIIKEEKIHKKFTDPKNRYLKFNKNILKKIKNNKKIKFLEKETWVKVILILNYIKKKLKKFWCF